MKNNIVCKSVYYNIDEGVQTNETLFREEKMVNRFLAIVFPVCKIRADYFRLRLGLGSVYSRLKVPNLFGLLK